MHIAIWFSSGNSLFPRRKGLRRELSRTGGVRGRGIPGFPDKHYLEETKRTGNIRMMNSFRIALSIFFIVALATTTALLVKKKHYVDATGAPALWFLEEAPAAQGGIPGGRNDPSSRQVLVKFKPYVTDVEIDRIAKISGMEVMRMLSPPNLFLFKIIGNSSLGDMIKTLERFEEIEYSGPNSPGRNSE
jgi:hypothetical protein